MALNIIEQPLELKIFKIINLNHQFLYAMFSSMFSYVFVLLQYEMDN